MATKAQREAHRRYALKVVEELTDPKQWPYSEIATVLTQQGVFTPFGTTEWNSRLVAALLIWDAFRNPKSLRLVWNIGSSRESQNEFEGLPNGPLAELCSEGTQAVDLADHVLHGGEVTTEVPPSLPPAHQAAYRDFALDLVKGLVDGPLNHGDVATVLTLRAIPTLDGHTQWHPIQVQRLLDTSGQWQLAELFVSERDSYDALARMEEEGGDVPF